MTKAMEQQADTRSGVHLDNGCRVTHGEAANVKTPFAGMPLVVHELYPGTKGHADNSFRGQFGFIPFTTDCRLPRHVHLHDDAQSGMPQLAAERILVVNGAGMAELNGEILIAVPGTLVDISPGAPHTWTALSARCCIARRNGLRRPISHDLPVRRADGIFPVKDTMPIASANAYEPHTGDLETSDFRHWIHGRLLNVDSMSGTNNSDPA